MKKQFIILLCLVCAPFLCGCAEVPLEISRFDPVVDRPEVKLVLINNEPQAVFEDDKYKITAGLYEYNTIFALILAIRNETDKDLPADDYSIRLADGRDLKTIRMLTRQDLMATKSKYSSGGGSGGFQDQLLQATMDTLMNTLNVSTKQRLIKIIDQGIEQYFAFRPIYANDKRDGVLCFLPDFKLEYPITLIIKIRDEKVEMRFTPPKK